MFRSISLFFKNKSALKQENGRNTIPFNKAKKIGVIVDDLDANGRAVSKFVDELEKEGKKVEVIGFTKTKEISGLKPNYKALRVKDFNWLGKIKREDLKKFIKTDFDYLFSLNTSSFLPFENILAQSRAKCRVGVYNQKKEGFFELMVQPKKKDDLVAVTQQMIRYTKLL